MDMRAIDQRDQMIADLREKLADRDAQLAAITQQACGESCASEISKLNEKLAAETKRADDAERKLNDETPIHEAYLSREADVARRHAASIDELQDECSAANDRAEAAEQKLAKATDCGIKDDTRCGDCLTCWRELWEGERSFEGAYQRVLVQTQEKLKEKEAELAAANADLALTDAHTVRRAMVQMQTEIDRLKDARHEHADAVDEQTGGRSVSEVVEENTTLRQQLEQLGEPGYVDALRTACQEVAQLCDEFPELELDQVESLPELVKLTIENRTTALAARVAELSRAGLEMRDAAIHYITKGTIHRDEEPRLRTAIAALEAATLAPTSPAFAEMVRAAIALSDWCGDPAEKPRGTPRAVHVLNLQQETDRLIDAYLAAKKAAGR